MKMVAQSNDTREDLYSTAMKMAYSIYSVQQTIHPTFYNLVQPKGIVYQFGFNGMEKDNETYGQGNAYDFGARIYDSRLGRWMSTDPLQASYAGMSSSNPEPNRISYQRGTRKYELSNHLGNVLTVITDRKIAANASGSGLATYYQADLVSISDYYPFGMQAKHRTWSVGDGYRFGFNGKEQDDEVSGQGNTIAFEARIYDSRLGRFFSTDPLEMEYAWQSTYAYFRNSPIAIVDILGMGGDEPENEKLSDDEDLGEGVQVDFAGWEYANTGSLAHKLFSQHFNEKDPMQLLWSTDKPISKENPIRPDLVYENGDKAGVWELKPAPPSPSAVFAAQEAQMYAYQLNKSREPDIYKVGNKGGAPRPVPENGLVLFDEQSNRKFLYTMPDPGDGAVFWTELKEGETTTLDKVITITIAAHLICEQVTKTSPKVIEVSTKTAMRSIPFFGIDAVIRSIITPSYLDQIPPES